MYVCVVVCVRICAGSVRVLVCASVAELKSEKRQPTGVTMEFMRWCWCIGAIRVCCVVRL